MIRCERKLELFSFDFYILGNKKGYIDKLLADGGKEHINIWHFLLNVTIVMDLYLGNLSSVN